MTTPIRQRDRQTILNALRAGVVPARGLEHLQVGRAAEVEALATDIQHLKAGSTAMRVLTGDFGSGKSFFLRVIRHAAQRAGCVTMNADITQDMRLYGAGGKVRALYANLVGSAGTKSQPEGGAMAEVLERFIETAIHEGRERNCDTETVVRGRLADLAQFHNGPLFADVVLAYAEGARTRDDRLQESALRWLRGEYLTATEAKRDLPVRGIVGDADLFPMLRLLAMLISKSGYSGLVIELDEMGVLARLNKPTRDQNYEQILTMVNNLLDGRARHLMIVFSGTSEFVGNEIRGMYSYGALRDRLTPNIFQSASLKDVNSPVIRLEPLSAEDLWVLFENVHRVYRSNNTRDPLSDRDAVIRAFLDHAASQLGGLGKVTPREATRSWLNLLDILHQNPGQDWRQLLGDVTVLTDQERDILPADLDSEDEAPMLSRASAGDGTNLANFQL
jgi:hypothetical protein